MQQSHDEVLAVCKEWQLTDAPDDLLLKGEAGEHNGKILAEAIALRFQNVYSKENLTAAYKATRSRLKLRQPKVIEKVVERVVEKPVEKIVKVTRPPQKLFVESKSEAGSETEFAERVRASEKAAADAKLEARSEAAIARAIAGFTLNSETKTEDLKTRLRARVERARRNGVKFQAIHADVERKINELYEVAEKETERIGQFRSLLNNVEV